ncbi:MAG TPA: adenylyl-sulfate kinase [Longimicrobium sp.]|nr:adenylyl-sulfate kinase [Longimicrobium sp.]
MSIATEAPVAKNLHWHEGQVTRAHRERAQGHRGATLWLTGLSASGKSTIARALEAELFRRGATVYVLDGDNVRHGLNRDLGFSPADRAENIRRIGEVARLLTEHGAIVVTAFISPYREDRDRARALMAEGDFVEVFVDADLAVCEARDPKGLYAKARRGEIPEFTGISAPYEPPASPELVVRTAGKTVDESVAELIAFLERSGYLRSEAALAWARADGEG